MLMPIMSAVGAFEPAGLPVTASSASTGTSVASPRPTNQHMGATSGGGLWLQCPINPSCLPEAPKATSGCNIATKSNHHDSPKSQLQYRKTFKPGSSSSKLPPCNIPSRKIFNQPLEGKIGPVHLNCLCN